MATGRLGRLKIFGKHSETLRHLFPNKKFPDFKTFSTNVEENTVLAFLRFYNILLVFKNFVGRSIWGNVGV